VLDNLELQPLKAGSVATFSGSRRRDISSPSAGYISNHRLQHSGFRHFTIQSLDADEIHELIDRWDDLSMGSDRDQVRLKQRLKEAIATRSDPKSGR